jgi:hypothetical protein
LAIIEGVKIVPAGWALNAASIPASVIGTLFCPLDVEEISCVPITCWVGFVNRSVRDWIDIRYTIA